MAAEPLAEWACRVVAAMPAVRRPEGLAWLSSRLMALDLAHCELVLAAQSRGLGVGLPTLRKMVRESRPWEPRRPRAERDAEAERERERQSKAQAQESALEVAAKQLAADPAVLHKAILAVEVLGVVGERRNIGIVRLQIRSRALQRPLNLEATSPASAGKTYVVTSTLQLESPDAYYELTASSERALIYLDESLEHRVLFVQEPEGLAQGVGAAALKSLIWEGRLKYDTVVKVDGQFIGQHVEKDGPTGLIVTTTRPLEEQLSSRMIRLEMDTSEEQTRRIITRIAEASAGGVQPTLDLAPWQAVSLLLGEPVEVEISFAGWLAEQIKTPTIRIRRDFTQLLTLVKASAIEHRFQRTQVPPGRLIATLADYAVVHSLAADVFRAAQAEGITEADRTYVVAVDELSQSGKNPTSQAKLAGHLRVSKAAVSYRVRRLCGLGYLANLEEQRGRPAKLVPGAPLPEIVPPLPAPCVLAQYLLDAGQEHLVLPWVDPVSGEGHDCRSHMVVSGEHLNTDPSAAPSSPSEVFIGGVNTPEHLNGPERQPDDVTVQPFSSVHPQYERSTDADDTPQRDDRSGGRQQDMWVEEL